MSYHPIVFQNLVDWLDGKLDERTQTALEAHLASGCPRCEADLAWLRRMQAAARFEGWQSPPAQSIAYVKSLYRRRQAERTAVARPPVRRWTWLPRLAAAALAVLVVLVGTGAVLTQVPRLIPQTATLSAFLGRVEIRSLPGDDWQPLIEGASVPETAHIRVAEGEAMVSLFDGSVLLIHPDTELALTALRSSLLGVSRQIVVRQLRGTVEYDVARLGHVRSSFRAETPNGSFAVQGTRFLLTVEKQEATHLSVFEGRVHVEVLHGNVQAANTVAAVRLSRDESAVVPAENVPILLPSLTPAPAGSPTPAPTVASTAEPSDTPQPAASTTPVTPTVPRPAATAEPQPTSQPVATTLPAPEPSPTTAATVTPTQTALPLAREPELISLSGPVESFPRSYVGEWLVGGRKVWVTSFTQINGTPRIGLTAQVTARPLSALAVVAVRIDVLSASDAGPTVTAEHQATVTATPAPRTSPISTSEPSETPTVTPMAAEKPTDPATPTVETPASQLTPGRTPPTNRTPVPRTSPTPPGKPIATETAAPSPTSSLEVENTATPLPPISPTAEPATETPTLPPAPQPTETPSPTPEATETTVPTPSPPPSETPVPPSPTPPDATSLRWTGKISQMPPGRNGPWVIAGRVVQVTPSTSIQGKPAQGLMAEVEATQIGGLLRAVRIVVIN